MYYIGIDIGTTSICGIVSNMENGQVVKSITKQNESWVHTNNKWEKTQDPAVIYLIVIDILNEFYTLNLDINGIGITGQMHGILYVDADGNAVSNLFTWQDMRANLPYNDVDTYAGYLSSITGYDVYPGFGLATHYYNIKNGLVPQNSRYICTIPDYIAMKLAGTIKPICDATMAASLGVFDLPLNNFNSLSLQKIGIDLNMLPKIVKSGTIIGYSQKSIPVAVAVGDNQASILGAVKNIDSSVLVNIGTGSQVSIYSHQYIEVPGLETRPFPGGGYIVVGAPLTGGKSLALLANFFNAVCKLFTDREAGNIYNIINSFDYSINSAEDMLKVNTQFMGTRQNALARGSITNISLENFTPENITVGFIEGMVSELYELYAAIPDKLRSNIKTLVGSGNAIRKNEIVKQAASEIFCLPVMIPKNQEEASFGAALCCAVGTGYIRDFHSAGQVIAYTNE